MKVVDSWKPAHCCGINRHVHKYEQAANIPWNTLRYISGHSDEKEFIHNSEGGCKVTLNQVRQKPGENNK
jgi:hypothetical protein